MRSELEKIEKGVPTAERIVPEKKPFTSKEITVKFNLKKLLIPGLVVAGIIIAAMIMIWRLRSPQAAVSSKSAAPSVAVLPFVDDSPAKRYEYLCEGIPNTLINTLNTIKNLRVTARTSAFSFAGKGLDILGIGQKLNVENVLEGSIQVVGNNLRVTASLVKVKDGYQLWNATYDRKLEDVYPRAKEAASKALEINENLAEAHNSLAYVYERYDWNWKAAEAEFKRALELNPNYATAHFWYGELLVHFGRSEEGIREMKQALELDPVSLIINASLGWAYAFAMQPDEALTQLQKTLEMDPNFAYARMLLWVISIRHLSWRTEPMREEMKC